MMITTKNSSDMMEPGCKKKLHISLVDWIWMTVNYRSVPQKMFKMHRYPRVMILQNKHYIAYTEITTRFKLFKTNI